MADGREWVLVGDIARDIFFSIYGKQHRFGEHGEKVRIKAIQTAIRRFVRSNEYVGQCVMNENRHLLCDSPERVKGWARDRYPKYQGSPAVVSETVRDGVTSKTRARAINSRDVTADNVLALQQKNEELQAVVAKYEKRSKDGQRHGRAGGRPRKR